MKIGISIFFVLILLVATSKLKVNIVSLQKDEKKSKVDFDIILGIYLLGFIKILGIHLKKDGIHFFGFIIPYKKIKMSNVSIRNFKMFSLRKFFNNLNGKLTKCKFVLKIGTENVFVTIFSVFAIATFWSIFSSKNSKRINIKNYDYKIIPIYNSNELSFQFSSKISINLLNIFKAFFFIKRENKVKKAKKMSIGQKSPLKI